MVEAKVEASVQRTPRAGTRDDYQYESSRYESATLSRLTQALGGCATEFATGSVRVAGGLVTDLCGAVLEPIDRMLGTGRRFRERMPDAESERRSEHSVSRALGRAVSGVADTAARSEDRFRQAIGGAQGAAFDRDAEREQLEAQTVAELKETADGEGIDLGEAHLKADIVNKVLRARAAKARSAAESKG